MCWFLLRREGSQRVGRQGGGGRTWGRVSCPCRPEVSKTGRTPPPSGPFPTPGTGGHLGQDLPTTRFYSVSRFQPPSPYDREHVAPFQTPWLAGVRGPTSELTGLRPVGDVLTFALVKTNSVAGDHRYTFHRTSLSGPSRHRGRFRPPPELVGRQWSGVSPVFRDTGEGGSGSVTVTHDSDRDGVTRESGPGLE